MQTATAQFLIVKRQVHPVQSTVFTIKKSRTSRCRYMHHVFDCVMFVIDTHTLIHFK